MEKKTVNVKINGTDYQVEAGKNILETCRSVGVEIPFFCYHPDLKVAGSCRMCLVYTGMPARDRATGEPIKNEDGSQKIAWMPKPSIACGTNVAEGMQIITDSDAVKDCRRAVLEFLLLNHPLDCPICDKAGECKLQEYTHAYGNAQSRYVESKNVKPKKVEVAGKIMLDAERCIQCSRCIRFCNEFVGKSIFGFTKHGSKTEIAVYPHADNDSNYLLNVVDGCPVGALTEKAFRFKMRTWFLKTADGICGESSAGVNTRIWSREGKIYRITPRRNDAVNGMWMSDSGRYEFRLFNEGNRVLRPLIDASPCALSYATDRCVEILKLGGVAIVANAWQTLEEQYITGELAKACGAEVYMVSHLREDDGKFVSADKTPNMRGAFLTGLVAQYPQANLDSLAKKVRSGEVKTILCLGENLRALGFDAKDFKSANIVFCGALENETSAAAKICIPFRSQFEKRGLWVNRQFRVQKFEKAVDAPEGTVDDLEFLATLLRDYTGASFALPSHGEIRRVMAAKIPQLANCASVGSAGMQIDGSAFANVDFPETDAVRFAKNQHAQK